MNGGWPTLVISVAILVLTVLLLRSVLAVRRIFLAGGGAPVRRRNRRMLRLVGIWQITIGAFMVSTGAWVNSIGLFCMGALMFATARVLTDMNRAADVPDLTDRKDIERWLREKPEPPA